MNDEYLPLYSSQEVFIAESDVEHCTRNKVSFNHEQELEGMTASDTTKRAV